MDVSAMSHGDSGVDASNISNASYLIPSRGVVQNNRCGAMSSARFPRWWDLSLVTTKFSESEGQARRPTGAFGRNRSDPPPQCCRSARMSQHCGIRPPIAPARARFPVLPRPSVDVPTARAPPRRGFNFAAGTIVAFHDEAGRLLGVERESKYWGLVPVEENGRGLPSPDGLQKVTSGDAAPPAGGASPPAPPSLRREERKSRIKV